MVARVTGMDHDGLVMAAAAGDAPRVQELLAEGVSPDPLWDDQTRAQAAAAHEELTADLIADTDPETAAALREAMAMTDPGSHDLPPADRIALFAAVDSDAPDVVTALLAAGCDPLVRDSQQRTALFRCSSEPVGRLLLKAGLSVQDVDGFGWTPLVANLDSIERVRLLLTLGSDPGATFDQGYTVFMAAVGNSERSPEVMRAIRAAGADIDAVSELGFNAWHAAIDVNGVANSRESVRATFRLLADWGVDLEQRTDAGSTPLHRALVFGTAVEVEELCAVGADASTSAPDDVTPLISVAAQVAVDPQAKVAALRAAAAQDTRG